MATRTAQIIIEIDDKSLIDLNAEIKILEASIKNIKIGTIEWVVQNEKLGKLKQQFLAATNEAKKLQNVVQKVSGSQQLQAIAKLGQGMVGAFAGVTTAIGLLGGSTEKLDEVAKKAQGFLAIMYSLQSISQTFSKANLAGLASIGQGFKGLVTAVKGFSTATKAALISTGIGALIVAVGLLIANFDKIKNLFSSGKQAKFAENLNKQAIEYTKLSEQQYQTALKTIELEKQRTFIQADAVAIAEAELTAAEAYNKFLIARMGELESELLVASTNRKLKKEEYEDLKKLIREKQKTLEQEILIGVETKQRAETNVQIAAQVKFFNDQAKEYQNRLTSISKNLYSQREQYDLNLKILQSQLKVLQESYNVNGDFTEEEKNKAEELNAQIDALNIQERLRIKSLENERKSLNLQEKISKLQSEMEEKFFSITDALTKENGIINANKKQFEDQIYILENQKKQYEELLKKKEELINFDNRGVGMLYEQNQELEDQLLSMNELFSQAAAMINIQLEGKKYDEDKIDAAAKELAFIKQINDAKISGFGNEKLGLENQRLSLKIDKERIITANNITLLKKQEAQLKLQEAKNNFNNAKTSEAQVAYQAEIVALQEEIAGYLTEERDTKLEISDIDNEILLVNNDILSVTQDINATTQDTADAAKELSDEVEKQSRGYKKLQDWVGKYNEEIQTTGQIISQSLAFVSTLFDANAQRHQDQIDALNSQYEIMNQKEADRLSRLTDLEEELKDANGDRYDELLSLIDQEKAAKDRNYISEVEQKNNIAKLEHKRLEDERKAAIWRKAQAVIEALIQTALAVVKSLPNVFLAVAVGILGATQVATIAAQKIPAVPPLQQFKKGGYTGSGNEKEIAGFVHQEEYVVPAKIVRSPQAQYHIESLEKQRLRGYVQGGFVSPVNSSMFESQIDYEKLAISLADAVSKLPNPQVALVSISNGLRDVNLTKQNAGLVR